MSVDIAALVPQTGTMCLLDSVIEWSQTAIICRAVSHLKADNPLRRDGRLSAVCGIEYALQTAALHGALRSGSSQPPGYLASLRLSSLTTAPLDDPALGALRAEALREHGDSSGMIYAISLQSESGLTLLAGRATIIVDAAP